MEERTTYWPATERDGGESGLYDRTFTVTGCTRQEIIDLGEYMNDRGIAFQRLRPDDYQEMPMCKVLWQEAAKALEIAIASLQDCDPGDSKTADRRRLFSIALRKLNAKLQKDDATTPRA